jgi:hypothetical protein
VVSEQRHPGLFDNRQAFVSLCTPRRDENCYPTAKATLENYDERRRKVDGLDGAGGVRPRFSLAARAAGESDFESHSVAARTADCAMRGNAILILAIAIRNHAQLTENNFGGGLTWPSAPDGRPGRFLITIFLARLETSLTSTKHTPEHVSSRHFWEGPDLDSQISRLRRWTASRAGISSDPYENRRAAGAGPLSHRSGCRRGLDRSSGGPPCRCWN